MLAECILSFICCSPVRNIFNIIWSVTLLSKFPTYLNNVNLQNQSIQTQVYHQNTRNHEAIMEVYITFRTTIDQY